MGHKRPNDPTPAIRALARNLARELSVVEPGARARLALLRRMHSETTGKRAHAIERGSLEAAGRYGRQAHAIRLAIVTTLATMRTLGLRPVHTAPHHAIC